MNPVVIFTNLFTLENKSVDNNKYIDIYFIWLNNIIKYGKLDEKDYCITFIDEVTFQYLSQNVLFISIINKIKNCIYILYKQPKTIKEGIMKRYDVDELMKVTKNIEELNPQYLHLDIDVLVVSNIRKLFSNTENNNNNKTTINLTADNHWEFLNGMFYGELASEEDIEIIKSRNIKIPGFSAGIFGWSNSIGIKEYFNFIKSKALSIDKEMYTVEQPFFNAAIFNYFFKEPGRFNFNILDKNKIKMNILLDKNTIFNESNEIVLIDYCGSPGDDKLHWNKIFGQLILQDL
jgi:hypothetical protein